MVLAERPTGIVRDAAGRLWHCEDGPALMFADGFVVYAWHGVRVPPDMIHGQPWSVAHILAEENVEVRRCAAEQMGWERFLVEADATLIAEAPDPGQRPAHPAALRVAREDARPRPHEGFAGLPVHQRFRRARWHPPALRHPRTR